MSPEKRICLDYLYYGRLLLKNGYDSLGLINIYKGYECDTTQTDVLNELAQAYNKLKKYEDVVNIYKIKISKEIASLTDYFLLGRTYYMLQKWEEADSIFDYVISKKPDYLPAHLYKARSKSNMDPKMEEGLAKPYYEKYVEMAVEDSLKNSKELVEAYDYLSFYYLTKKDLCKSRYYSQKIVELDPKNENGIKRLQGLKNVKCN